MCISVERLKTVRENKGREFTPCLLYTSVIIGTLESYVQIRDFFGAEHVVPIYIDVEDGLRLSRALERERKQAQPKYAELCRRFLADTADFSQEKRKACGIHQIYENIDIETCLNRIRTDIVKMRENEMCIRDSLYALARLSSYTRDAQFLNMAWQAFLYERTLYKHEMGGWLDLRCV